MAINGERVLERLALCKIPNPRVDIIDVCQIVRTISISSQSQSASQTMKYIQVTWASKSGLIIK